MNKLNIPISEDAVRSLNAGDVVHLNGVMVTARDAAHKYLVDTLIAGKAAGEDVDIQARLTEILREGVIYHCGPVIAREGDTVRFVSAGPTTSIREEPYEATVIGHFNVRAVIGKGGMGKKTLAACKEHGCVYLHAVGGAGTLIARAVKEVKGVLKEEFGSPEAFWIIEVEDFPAVVTMDAHGKSLHEDILASSTEAFGKVVQKG